MKKLGIILDDIKTIEEMSKTELREAIDHYSKLIDKGIDYRDGKEIPDRILPTLFIIRQQYEKELNGRIC